MARCYNVVQIILLAVAVTFALGIGGAKLLFHISPHIVLSGSMEPTIPTGSLCFVNEKLTSPQKGDIIAFSKGGLLITHRMVANEGDLYITKGDHNDSPDPATVSRQEVIGTNIFWIPKAGYAAAYLQSRSGRIIVITALLVFLLIGNVLPEKRRRNLDEKN